MPRYIANLTTEDMVIWARKSDASRAVHLYMVRYGDHWDYELMQAMLKDKAQHQPDGTWIEYRNQWASWCAGIDPTVPPPMIAPTLAMTDIGSTPSVH